MKFLSCTGDCPECKLEDCPSDCPHVYIYIEEDEDVYTLSWTNDAGALMKHIELARSKEHALSKALSNSLVNLWIFDYLETFNFRPNPVHFLWTKNGRIN